jgi:hypothetical protein
VTKASFVCSLATVAILAVGNQASAAIGGLVLSDVELQSDFAGPFADSLVITDNPFDFSGQDYGLLAAIDSLSITLTVEDGDTDVGEFDHNDWTLGLDGVDTGLVLNGFSNDLTVTKSFNQIPVPAQDQILANLKADGQLIATIIDRDHPNNNWVALCCDTHYATLTLEGQHMPEPSTMVIWSLLGTSVAGLAWWRRRKAA